MCIEKKVNWKKPSKPMMQVCYTFNDVISCGKDVFVSNEKPFDQKWIAKFWNAVSKCQIFDSMHGWSWGT